MRRILLVEDEDMLREVYALILLSEAYGLDIATNGREALDLCAQKSYDLILLDLMMPRLDGLGFLREFTQPTDRRTKIIVLSNLSAGKELTEALSLGAHKSVLKASLSPRQLLATVRYELEA